MVQLIVGAAKSILIPPLVGILSGLFIRNNTGIYNVVLRPPFALPSNAFAIVWGILYILMGISLFLFKRSDISKEQKNEGLLLFFTQLFLNFLWPILFFNARLWFASFLLLVLLFVYVAFTTIKFYDANRLSGILLLPYLLFLVYAGYLNFGVWYLNM